MLISEVSNSIQEFDNYLMANQLEAKIYFYSGLIIFIILFASFVIWSSDKSINKLKAMIDDFDKNEGRA